jgi:hypothetical protein
MLPVAIIGGGPAGLAAASVLRAAGVDFRLFDHGPPLGARRHDRAEDLGIGIGGAGLFSDGKFSFFPSGTHLYALSSRPQLKAAYGAMLDHLAAAGIEAPPFPQDETAPVAGEGFRTKAYVSHYGTLPQRVRLIEALTRGYEARIHTHCRVEELTRGAGGYRIVHRARDTGLATAGSFAGVILATGRLGGRDFAGMLDGAAPLTDQRIELGIRIEHPNEIGFLKTCKTPDVKFILDEGTVEVRTFCTCRRGEVWLIPYDEVSALSGRSDGPPSGHSNFGLLPRFHGADPVGRAALRHFEATRAGIPGAVWQPLPAFLGRTDVTGPTTLEGRPWHPRDDFRRGDLASILHPDLRDILRAAIGALVARYPDLLSNEAVCLFPALEGVGCYPASDLALRVPGESIWCSGDVVGRFRGLVPAMVSGAYAGQAVAAWIAAGAPAADPVPAAAPEAAIAVAAE